MAGTEQFMIGAEASCTDGPCGKLTRVVVDPVARAVTHLVVGPNHEPGAARLVPVDMVDAAGAAAAGI
jgi:sporulation protein YlmC with PRC-barrel domain